MIDSHFDIQSLAGAPHQTRAAENSPRSFSPIIGADIAIRDSQPMLLPVKAEFEHALFVLEGDVRLNRRIRPDYASARQNLLMIEAALQDSRK